MFSFLYYFYKLQELSEETSKCYCINLYLKLNSELHEADFFEELNLFRKIVLWESSTLDVWKFIFWNNLSKCIPVLLQTIK